jgi:hypothetical protein
VVGFAVTDYALTGKKGTGKSKHAVLLARDRYLSRGQTVATNLDIYLEPMFGPMSRITYIRVPDKPTEFDLLAAGHGNPDSYDEDKNGGMFLDELATWLNTRTFADKHRAGVLDYLAHGRKHGWDMWYIMQNVLQVDKQLREAFIEQTVRHTRFDKVRIPFVGGALSALFGEKAGFFPRFHSAVYRMGVNPQDLVTNRATYIGKDIEKCYDTRQVFDAAYPHGTHSVLSPWHVKGRYMQAEKPSLWSAVTAWFSAALAPAKPRPLPHPVTRPDPAMARVLALASTLSPSERMRVVSRYMRLSTRPL